MYNLHTVVMPSEVAAICFLPGANVIMTASKPGMVAHACNSASGRQGFRGVWRYLGVIPQGAWASCDRGDGA
jgi:hypothetical protein